MPAAFWLEGVNKMSDVGRVIILNPDEFENTPQSELLGVIYKVIKQGDCRVVLVDDDKKPYPPSTLTYWANFERKDGSKYARGLPRKYFEFI